jgi:hypothetical protein
MKQDSWVISQRHIDFSVNRPFLWKVHPDLLIANCFLLEKFEEANILMTLGECDKVGFVSSKESGKGRNDQIL